MVPAHYEARCPISPDGAPHQQHSHFHQHPGVTSPSNNSDNNFYQSPVLSPGDWNVASPEAIVSPYSSNASWRSYDSSVQGSPLSAPAALASSHQSNSTTNKPPRLPSELGSTKQDMEEQTDTQRRKTLEIVNKRFIAKSSFDQEREKNAVKKANSLMTVTLGRSGTNSTETPKKIMITNRKPVGRVVIVPHGQEHMASSTWKGRKAPDESGKSTDDVKQNKKEVAAEFEEHVDDFKCELDREREKWAQKQALKMIKGAGNFL